MLETEEEGCRKLRAEERIAAESSFCKERCRKPRFPHRRKDAGNRGSVLDGRILETEALS